MNQAFAVWLTGPPASGKSAIARKLKSRLAATGLEVEVLESDAVRQVITPQPTYRPDERELFYRALAFSGSRLVSHGVPVIFDATANRRAHRDLARTLIPNFIEVMVACPVEICRQRDRKGTYRRGLEGESSTVPGLQEPYEPPLQPEVEIDTTQLGPGDVAERILEVLQGRGYLQAARVSADWPL